jgi:hypothetical protein
VTAPPLEWRGAPVDLLTTDEVKEMAAWALAEIDRLRAERDKYIDRAIAAELEIDQLRRERDAYLKRAVAKMQRDMNGWDTRAERDIDMGDRVERLTSEYRGD